MMHLVLGRKMLDFRFVSQFRIFQCNFFLSKRQRIFPLVRLLLARSTSSLRDENLGEVLNLAPQGRCARPSQRRIRNLSFSRACNAIEGDR